MGILKYLFEEMQNLYKDKNYDANLGEELVKFTLDFLKNNNILKKIDYKALEKSILSKTPKIFDKAEVVEDASSDD